MRNQATLEFLQNLLDHHPNHHPQTLNPKATFEFLQNFLDHQHLRMVRITDYDFKCLFHGSDGVCVCVCVCVRARARAQYFRACANVFVNPSHTGLNVDWRAYFELPTNELLN